MIEAKSNDVETGASPRFPKRWARASWPLGITWGIAWGLAFVGVFATACSRRTSEEAAAEVRIDVQRYRAELLPDDQTRGGETPLVTVVVFSDYACPPCGRTWQVMDNLLEDYGEDLRVVFRAYTVPGFGRGEQAAEAAFAAGAQGKFWEMHGRLFAEPGALDRPTLKAHAAALGLDVERFLDELDTGVHTAPRMRHRRMAKQLGIVGLPAMFVNGVYLAGYSDEAAWHAVIDEEIRRAKAMIAEGTPRAKLYETISSKASTDRVAPPKGAEALQKKLDERDAEAERALQLTAPDPSKRYRIEPGLAPRIGPEDAPVVVVAFVDVLCPYCRRAWTDEIAALVEARKGEVAFAIREMPLAIHPPAKGAAVAALAAARQGKYWEFHDKLLRADEELGRNVFVEMAKELGLDEAKFVADLDDPELTQQVEQDAKLGLAVGVTGTPGYFVNGRYAHGYRPGEVAALVEEELEQVKQRMKEEGLERGEVFPKLMAEAVQPTEFPNQ